MGKNQMMDIKLVLFDCDGTLIDSEYINNKATSDVLVALGHTKFTIPYCMEYFAGCSIHDVRNALEELKIADIESTLEKMQNITIELAKTGLAPIKNSLELMHDIKLPKCVVSNGERHLVLHSLKVTGLNKYFDDAKVFTRDLVVRPKPAPDLYLYAAQKSGDILPQHCLVIEDSVKGITAGKAAGMHVLGFVGGNHHNSETKAILRNSGAFAIIEDLSEVMEFL